MTSPAPESAQDSSPTAQPDDTSPAPLTGHPSPALTPPATGDESSEPAAGGAPDRRHWLIAAGDVSAVGLEMGLSVAIGLGAGWWLDRKLGTHRVCSLVGLLVGIGAAFLGLWKGVRRAQRAAAREELAAAPMAAALPPGSLQPKATGCIGDPDPGRPPQPAEQGTCADAGAGGDPQTGGLSREP